MTPGRAPRRVPRVRTSGEDDLSPFPSLESAQEYISLLGTAVDDARSDIEQDIESAGTEHADRRLEALHLVNYKLNQLRNQVNATGRLLNDLRTLRRLLLSERSLKAVTPETVRRHSLVTKRLEK
jgi:hypothetical protein